MLPNEEKIPRAVRNEWFYLVARACMILALPVLGILMQRIIAKADEISTQLSVQIIDLKLLSNRVDFQLRLDTEKLTDHELRLRGLERK